jgi:hypothetical protein
LELGKAERRASVGAPSIARPANPLPQFGSSGKNDTDETLFNLDASSVFIYIGTERQPEGFKAVSLIIGDLTGLKDTIGV